ncbi:uncharacterized protein [Macrobrachium rosenbergii]|uniref:uncharacterized protein n=1 Tax=Macrobrachium rosenbergii TaxID=79674 RepID=UPI0034D4DD79
MIAGYRRDGAYPREKWTSHTLVYQAGSTQQKLVDQAGRRCLPAPTSPSLASPASADARRCEIVLCSETVFVYCACFINFEMDVENLITCVLQRPALWDKKDKMYANRNIVDKCWSEISGEMQYDETELRKKWKYLRDQFTVELRKYPTGDAAADSQTPKWRYFKSLMFLKDVVKARPSTGNLSDALSSEVHSDDVELSEEGVVISPTHTRDTLIDERMEINGNNRSTKYLRTDNQCQSILDAERQKLQYLLEKSSRKRAREEDEDLLFFRSLLPHVKKIPDSEKLTFRNRIHEVVEQFVYK